MLNPHNFYGVVGALVTILVLGVLAYYYKSW